MNYKNKYYKYKLKYLTLKKIIGGTNSQDKAAGILVTLAAAEEEEAAAAVDSSQSNKSDVSTTTDLIFAPNIPDTLQELDGESDGESGSIDEAVSQTDSKEEQSPVTPGNSKNLIRASYPGEHGSISESTDERPPPEKKHKK